MLHRAKLMRRAGLLLRTSVHHLVSETPKNHAASITALNLVRRAITAVSGHNSAVERLARDPDAAERAYLEARANMVRQHFPGALSVDDFLHRLEIALHAFGFTGDNSIAMTNLCRDEITVIAKDKLEAIFGSSFNVNGLGGVLTCGVTGLKAGLSHSPVCGASGKERYIFFSFPHVSIDASGEVGAISRPWRAGSSSACGALIACLSAIRADGLEASCKPPGVHDYSEPELSLLKQRLARRIRFEGLSDQQVHELDLAQLTRLAERTITDDLEYLIARAVDPQRADYAVVTGVQVHNYGVEFHDDSPNLEFLSPNEVYVVVDGGDRAYIDLEAIPALTPRQTHLLASSKGPGPPLEPGQVVNSAGPTTVRSIDEPSLHARTDRKEGRSKMYAEAAVAAAARRGSEADISDIRGDTSISHWRSRITAPTPIDNANSVAVDYMERDDQALSSTVTREYEKQLRQVAKWKKDREGVKK